jgi:protein O-mannosyl-transferase
MAKNKRNTQADKSHAISRGTVSSHEPGKRKPVSKEPSRGLFGMGGGQLSWQAHALIMAGITILAWLVLSPCLGNQFTNWDDPGYIQDNPLVKDLSLAGLKAIGSSSVMGNYAPLTVLSYAIEYGFVRLAPWLYHFDNLLLHLMDALLVYWLVYLLTRRAVAAVVTTLLFSLHPMHIESVAWVSGRKDVLYAAFYLSACIAYIYYTRATDRQRWKWYAAVLALFTCSLLAKPVAVTLPLTLLLIDYFEQRTWKFALLLEKLPHFMLAVLFGVIALNVQHKAGAMDMQKIHYNFIERIALGGYAFITYLWKAAVPISLSNFYTYPQKIGDALPFVYYLYLLAAAAIIVLAWIYLRKNRIVTFGVGLFVTGIALLLQFVPVGDAILADRYTYLPYLGLFFIAGWYVSEFNKSSAGRKYGKSLTGAFVVYFTGLVILANERCSVWHDPVSLWTDAIEKDPSNTGAYNNLGFVYYRKWIDEGNPVYKQKYYDSAYYLLTRAIALKPDFVNPHISLGEMERGAGKYSEAKENYFSAMKLNSKDPNLTLGLAILYYITKDYDSAGYWFRRALVVDPSAQAHGNYANFLNLTGKGDSALVEYGKAISISPGQYVAYLNRGKVYRDANRLEEAVRDFDEVIKLDPDIGEAYYDRSMCYDRLGNKTHARQDAERAMALGYKVDDSYYKRLQ